MNNIWLAPPELNEEEKVVFFMNWIANDESLVVFTAPWCAACHALEPMLTSLTEANTFRLIFVDVKEAPRVAEHYQVSALPTLILFSHGSPITSLTGAISKDAIMKRLQTHFTGVKA